MTPELETYFDNFFDLFNTEGWKQLTQELTQNALNINQLTQTKDNDDLNFRKGQLNILATIVNLPESIEQGFKDASEPEEDLDAEDI